MKKTRLIQAFAVLVLLILQPVLTPEARAADQTNDEITALLTSGQWLFQGQGWGNMRTFKTDGTFHGRKDGNWKIEGDKVRLIFADHEDDLLLPLDPKGTKGTDSKGLPLTAVQQPLTDATPAIAANPAPPAPPPNVAPAFMAMLTGGQWYFQGMNWSNVRVFKQDGTFTTQRHDGQSGTWKVLGGALVLSFNSFGEKIFLPINPGGSKGADEQEKRMVVLQQPLVEPTPAPVPPAEITPAMLEAGKTSTQSEAEARAMLAQGQWYFQGRSWANVRVFNADGTFKGGGDGTWKIADGKVALESHGRQESFIFPVDPKGTKGIDSKGIPMIALQQPIKPLPPKMGGLRTVNHSAQSDAMIGEMLTQGQWYFQGRSWANIRVFQPDGTFYTPQRPGEGGTWKIIDGMVVLSLKSTENLLMLPIDTQFTIGQDAEGLPILAFQQALAEPTPTPKPEVIAKAVPGRTNSPGPSAVNTVPKGTPAYFGTTRPDAGGAPVEPAATPMPSAPAPAPAAAPAPATIAPELQQKAADLVKTYNGSLVVVSGNGGNGSGFIATMGGVSYLITNTHLIAEVREPAFKDLDDKVVPYGKASIAVRADVLRLEAQTGKPMEVMEDVNQNASIGDDIAVLGNSEGAGVVNTIMGKIVGIGPSLIEIDAQIVPGNSGSPIVHLKSGKVIGIASFQSVKQYDPATAAQVKAPVIRYFGYRLDSVKAWQPVVWQSFYAQASAIQKLQGFTTDLDEFYQDLSTNGRVSGAHTNPLIKDRIEEWVKDKSHGLNAEDGERMNETFASFMKDIAQTDVNAARQMVTYDYFQRKLAEVQLVRAGIAQDLEKIIMHKQ